MTPTTAGLAVINPIVSGHMLWSSLRGKLRRVGGILDYAAEADPEAAEGISINQPTRVYPYESEAACDANARTFLSAVRAVHDTTPEGFAAVKVTALGDPALLCRVSSAILSVKRAFMPASF